jgi:FKBP-type peptidyl-prolyl cis-trans isomerase (trigger factor)
MSITTKKPTKLDYEQAIQGSFNDVNSTLSVDGFIVGKVGHKIVKENFSATEEDYSFYDNTTLLYKLRITYTSALKQDLASVERIA